MSWTEDEAGNEVPGIYFFKPTAGQTSDCSEQPRRTSEGRQKATAILALALDLGLIGVGRLTARPRDPTQSKYFVSYWRALLDQMRKIANWLHHEHRQLQWSRMWGSNRQDNSSKAHNGPKTCTMQRKTCLKVLMRPFQRFVRRH
jgi:hypothetical protein